MTLWPFAPLIFPSTSSLLWPLLTSCPLSPTRSPRVRTCTFEPGRQALPDMAFGDGWISRSLARSSPISGLSACFCSCGRLFATPFFQPHLTASTLGFATLVVTACDDLLSDHKYMPMSGTLAAALVAARPINARTRPGPAPVARECRADRPAATAIPGRSDVRPHPDRAVLRACRPGDCARR